MAKRRPCVGLSVKEVNEHRRTVVVLPLTTTETPAVWVFPLLLATPSVSASSKVRIEHIRAIDKARLAGNITRMGDDDLAEIERALCQVLALRPQAASRA